MIHPEGAGIEMAVARNYTHREADFKRNEITYNLQLLDELYKTFPDNIEIRTIKFPLAYGVTAVNPDKVSGVLYLEHYCFRVATDSFPKYVLNARDGRWFEFFKSEIKALWEAGEKYACNNKIQDK